MSSKIPTETSAKSKKKKRKATSPLSTETQNTGKAINSNQSPGTQVNPDGHASSNQNNSECLLNVEQSHLPCSMMSNPMMNMTSPIGPYTQPYFAFTPTQTPPVAHQSQSMLTPPWALTLIDEVKSLKSSSENVEKTVYSINNKISAMEKRMQSLETKVNEVETSCNFVSTEFDKQKIELKETKAQITKLQTSHRNLESKSASLQKQKSEITEKLADLESRSMRENLIFYGIPEVSNKRDDPENCEALVKSLISEKLGLDGHSMSFDRAHRLGPNSANKPRGIVVKFHYYSEREQVRRRSYDKEAKKSLQDNNYGVGIQRPYVVREGRRAFSNIITAEEKKGNTVRVNGLRLFVNGRLTKVYIDGEVSDPPPYMLPSTR